MLDLFQYFDIKQLILCSGALFTLALSHWVITEPCSHFILHFWGDKPQPKDFEARLQKIILPILAVTIFSLVLAFGGFIAQEVKLITLIDQICFLWLAITVINTLKKDFISKVLSVVVVIYTLRLMGLADVIDSIIPSVTIKILDNSFTLLHILNLFVAMVAFIWFTTAFDTLGTGIVEAYLAKYDRHTKTTYLKLFRYFTMSIFVLVGLGMIGVQASHLAMVGSAIALGVGFGLQKIISNFVSGLIILGERTIKIGDILEIDKTTRGKVTNLGIRSTIINTMDGRDFIIPNENFITNPTINITLTSKGQSVVIPLTFIDLEQMEKSTQIMNEIKNNLAQNNKITDIVFYVDEVKETSFVLLFSFWINDITKSNISIIKADILQQIAQTMRKSNIKVIYKL